MYKRAIGTFKNFAIKHMKSTSTLQNNKPVAKVGTAEETLNISSPFEALLGCLGNCTIHTTMFYANKNKVNISNMEVDVQGEYDSDYFLGKKEGKNTFSTITLNTKVYSSDDKDKVAHTVEEGHKFCPVLSTLRNAGIEIKSDFKYL